MNDQEMQDLIQSVCEEFSSETQLNVTEQARARLFEPTVPHLTDVTRELREERISPAFLRQSVRKVIDNAHSFARERKHDYIGFEDIRDSMEKDCPYVFWC